MKLPLLTCTMADTINTTQHSQYSVRTEGTDGEVAVDAISEEGLVDVVGSTLNFLPLWRQFLYVLLVQCSLTGVAKGCGFVTRLCYLPSRGGDLAHTLAPCSTHHLTPEGVVIHG